MELWVVNRHVGNYSLIGTSCAVFAKECGLMAQRAEA